MSFLQKGGFYASGLLQLLILLIYASLLLLNSLALSALISRILAHEAQSAVYLAEVLTGEYEHQFSLNATALRHIAYGLGILLLSGFQLSLEFLELSIEDTNIPIQAMNIMIDGVNALPTTVHLAIYHHELSQFLLHLCLISTESLLLTTDILLDFRLLIAQTFNLRIAHFRSFRFASPHVFFRSGGFFASGSGTFLRYGL